MTGTMETARPRTAPTPSTPPNRRSTRNGPGHGQARTSSRATTDQTPEKSPLDNPKLFRDAEPERGGERRVTSVMGGGLTPSLVPCNAMVPTGTFAPGADFTGGHTMRW